MTHKAIAKLKEFLNDNHKLVFDKMEEKGYEIYIVGGSVRDSLLGKEVDDIDFTTSATPEQIMEVFSEFTCLDNGLKHGTVPVIINGEMIEITTYRVDGDYTDGRRPDEVEFTTSLEEDLARRDFTINSLAYSPSAGIVDLKGGKEDLAIELIRAVGDAEARFEEDALRIMRGLRFASRLGFYIEEETKRAMFAKKENLKKISSERIHAELNGVILGKHAKEILRDYKEIFAVFIPEIEEMFDFEQDSPYHIHDVWSHTLEVLENSEESVEFKLAALLHDIGKPKVHEFNEKKGYSQFINHEEESAKIAEVILRRLKYSNEVRIKTLKLIEFHGVELSKKPYRVKKFIYEHGVDFFFDLVSFKKADNSAKNEEFGAKKNAELDELLEIAEEYLSGSPLFSHKDLVVGAEELMEEGITGAALGWTLNEMVLYVLSGVENKKEALLKHAKRIQKDFKKQSSK